MRTSTLCLSFLFSLMTAVELSQAQSSTLRVGVWNIEKLSKTASRGFPELTGQNSLPPRTDAQLEDIAKYLRDQLKIGALMITEIEADAPQSTADRPQSAQLNRICEHLGANWRYFLSRTGGKMRLGLLFDSDRVQLKKLINLPADRFLVTGTDVFDRDPFIVWISALDGGEERNDAILICLHLKSIQDRFRNNRMAAVAKLIGDIDDKEVRQQLTLPSKSEEPETLILGDLNDSSHTLNGFHYLFDYLPGVGYGHLRPPSGDYPHTRFNGSQIDHIFASRGFRDGSMVANTFQVHFVGAPNSAEGKEYRKTFSDHFPVTIDMRKDSDDDSTLNEIAVIPDATERAERFEALSEAIRAEESEAAETLDEDASDDEEIDRVLIDAEIIDSNFERILAPQPADAAPAERPISAGVAEAPAGASEAAISPDESAQPGSVSGRRRLSTAIGIIQKEITDLLATDAPLSVEDAERLEALLEAERALVRQAANSP